jgi:hypothetical protein
MFLSFPYYFLHALFVPYMLVLIRERHTGRSFKGHGDIPRHNSDNSKYVNLYYVRHLRNKSESIQNLRP